MPTLSEQTRNLVLVSGAVVGVVGVSWALYRWKQRGKLRTLRVAELLGELAKEHVHVRDLERAGEIMIALMEDGADQLQVVSDFDRTLSRSRAPDGKPVPSCHGAIERCHLLDPEVAKECRKLFEFYFPKEIDPSIPKEEKFPMMVEWWTSVHNLLVKARVTVETVKVIASDSGIILRDRLQEMFELLYDRKVPLLIFSAGLSNILEEVINSQGVLYDNVTIVSNRMLFDEVGLLTGYTEPLLHTYNKNAASAAEYADYFVVNKQRRNVILLGDTIGDTHMIDGLDYVNCVLKLGFLNENNADNLKAYKEVYDIVIVCDESVNVPLALLHRILK